MKFKLNGDNFKALVSNHHVLCKALDNSEEVALHFMIKGKRKDKSLMLDKSKRKIIVFVKGEEDVVFVEIKESDNYPEELFLKFDEEYNWGKEEAFDPKLCWQ